MINKEKHLALSDIFLLEYINYLPGIFIPFFAEIFHFIKDYSQ